MVITYRTDLRELNELRTEMSDLRTEVAGLRTGMAAQRAELIPTVSC